MGDGRCRSKGRNSTPVACLPGFTSAVFCVRNTAVEAFEGIGSSLVGRTTGARRL